MALAFYLSILEKRNGWRKAGRQKAASAAIFVLVHAKPPLRAHCGN
jgi:hypothetical protein